MKKDFGLDDLDMVLIRTHVYIICLMCLYLITKFVRFLVQCLQTTADIKHYFCLLFH